MPAVPRFHLGRRTASLLLVICAIGVGCTASEPIARENNAVSVPDYVEPIATATVQQNEPTSPSVTPTMQPFVEEGSDAVQPELTGELPRTTEAGIRIEKEFGRNDLGSGEMDTVAFTGRSGSGTVGVFLDRTFATTPVEATDREAWAASGGVLIVVFRTEADVVELTLRSSNGTTDRAAPDADGVVVLAVPGNNADGTTAEAIDAEGTLVATCGTDEEFGFFECG